jgi:hypothetical protein
MDGADYIDARGAHHARSVLSGDEPRRLHRWVVWNDVAGRAK